MQVLVTGATGFVGSHIVEALLAVGHHPVALVRRSGNARLLHSLGVPIRYGDITDRNSLGAALEGCEGVVHAAGLVEGVGRKADFDRTNIDGARNIVELAAAAGVRRLVNIASLVVYARHRRQGVVVDETEALLCERPPTWDHYTRTKLAAERIALAAHRPGVMEVTSIRPGFTFGPRDFTFSATLVSALRAGRWPLPGGGRTHVPSIYVTDMARMGLLCLEREEAQGHAFACVAEPFITYAELITAFANALGVSPPRLGLPYGLAYALALGTEVIWRVTGRSGTPPMSRFLVAAMRVDAMVVASRGRDLLGWRPEVSLADAVHRTVAWARHAGLT